MAAARTHTELAEQVETLADLTIPETRWVHTWHRLDADLRQAYAAGEITDEQDAALTGRLIELWQGRHS